MADPRTQDKPLTRSEALQDSAIARAARLERFKSGAVRRVTERLDARLYVRVSELVAAGMERVRVRGTDVLPSRHAGYRKLLGRVQRTARERFADEFSAFSADLAQVAQLEEEIAAREIAAALLLLGIRKKLVRPTAGAVRDAAKRAVVGRTLREWANGAATGFTSGVKAAIQTTISRAEEAKDALARIRGARSVTATSKGAVESLIRSAVTSAAAIAREELYQENSDIIDRVLWVSTLDSSTCPVCADLDGEIFAVGEGPRPPIHLNCRCTTSPVLVGEKAPARITFHAWLAKQKPKVQDEVLGPTRAALYRAGGLSISDFVDQQGRTYTIEQLREREARAFKRAGIS
jgi:SPP1 gp7 family putative phage head morphogenesis protein